MRTIIFHRLSFAALFIGCLTLFAADASAQTAKRRTRKARPVMTKKTVATAAPKAPVIARGTQMKIRLRDAIDTKSSKDGDRFTATVIDPSSYADAVIEGHLAKVDQSGKFKGRTSLVISFDTIKFSNGASSAMAAQVVKVYGEDLNVLQDKAIQIKNVLSKAVFS